MSQAAIKIVGVGGAGQNAVQRMIANKVSDVDFITIDAGIKAEGTTEDSYTHITLEKNPSPGANIEDSSAYRKTLYAALQGAEMVFVTCGLGRGTGTNISPIVVEIAKELGALTIGVVTTPFSFEGARRKKSAEAGVEELRAKADCLITVNNNNILQVSDKRTSFLEGFAIADEILMEAIKGVSELITRHAYINVDLADVRTVLTNSGDALIGIGHASGEDRAIKAAQEAIKSPLLNLPITGAKGILLSIAGSEAMSLAEIQEIAQFITEQSDPDCTVIFGARIDEGLKEELEVTVVATGLVVPQKTPGPTPKY